MGMTELSTTQRVQVTPRVGIHTFTGVLVSVWVGEIGAAIGAGVIVGMLLSTFK
ncbi:MAG: hypothetical protein UY52_C0016G0056 [Parcubacteria group bacterium GW2011_GWC2_49_9]|nr:MAG: hypothetical protein UY34_C0031G0003 [Parcubacteria group bacterium GW2011_GWA2_48_9]KKW15679.1 MAG: hypothetical protein UY52_C0016G0056 [Parcubacteria group bacterium GW2011_GWC2_49_9]